MTMLQNGAFKKIKKTDDEIEIEWIIKNINSTSRLGLYSPDFKVLGQCWGLNIFPDGCYPGNSDGWIGLYLFIKTEIKMDINVAVTLTLMSEDGKTYAYRDFTHVFNEMNSQTGIGNFYPRSLIKRWQLAPSGAITIICSVRRQASNSVHNHYHCRIPSKSNWKIIPGQKDTTSLYTKSMTGYVRNIKNTCDETEIEWTVSDFFSFPSLCRYSPDFNFLGVRWCLQVFPDGGIQGNSRGCTGLYLHARDQVSELNLAVTFSVKSNIGNRLGQQSLTHVFKEGSYMTGIGNFYSISMVEFYMKPPSWMCNGASSLVTFICSVKRHEVKSILGVSSGDMMEDEQVGKAALVDPSIQIENSETYPSSLEKTVKNLTALSQSLKALLFSGECHDLMLRVKGTEFRVHQNIIRARSQVLDSALKHDMVEKNSGVISIDDCDPDAFEQFLIYVYSGKVETLDEDNMLGLYYIADKYHLPDLKEETHEFIKKSLSPGVICDVIRLALNHDDLDLMSHATDYFAENVNEILTTDEWQAFITENAIQANILFIKAATYLSENTNHSKA